MDQGAIVDAAVKHLQTYVASLRKDDHRYLIRILDDQTSSSTLPKIKYWFGLLMKALQSESEAEIKNACLSCDAISELLVSLLCILDDTDVNNLQIETEAMKPNKRNASIVQTGPGRRKKLPVRSADLVEAMHESREIGLHDDSHDSSELFLGSAEPYHRAKKQKCADVSVSVKDVLNAKTTDFGDSTDDMLSSEREKKETIKTTLLLDAAILRRDVYKLLVHVDTMNIRKCIVSKIDGEEVQCTASEMISSLLRRINAHPNTPSIRLSSIMAVDYLREKGLSDTGYQLLLDALLSSTLSSSNAIYVRFYAEIVSECNIYASPSRLLHALVHLMKECLRMNKMEKTCQHDSQGIQSTSKAMEKNLLHAIAQIMVRRSNVLRSLDVDVGRDVGKLYSSYKLTIRRMATVYDKVSYWISSDASNHMQEEVVSVLQAEGILSLFCWDETDDEQSEASIHSSQTFERRNHLASLRSAHDRIGPCLGFDKLLSHSSSYAKKARSEGVSRDDGGCCSSFSGINSDVLRDIFSFLGYRSLARASTACKNWNIASKDDRLWITLYFRKYKNAFYEEEYAKGIARLRQAGYFDKFTSLSTSEERKELAKALVVESHYDWRYIFKRKYQTEKHVSKTFLRCDVIGCAAHFGKRSVNMHKKMHEKVITTRATATAALKKQEMKLDTLRKKVCLLDAANASQETTREPADVMSVLPLHSPEDTLTMVFSFLEVKDLLKPVCKVWKNIVNDNDTLWQNLCFSHFGLQKHATNTPPSWSACFRATFNAEKRRCKIARHDSLGWATRVCPVAGCCTALYNKLAYSKHILTHEEQSLTRRIQQTKKKRKNTSKRSRK